MSATLTLPDADADADANAGAVPGPYLVLGIECARPVAGASRYSLAGIDEVRIGRGDDRRARRTARVLAIEVPDDALSLAVSTHPTRHAAHQCASVRNAATRAARARGLTRQRWQSPRSGTSLPTSIVGLYAHSHFESGVMRGAELDNLGSPQTSNETLTYVRGA